MEYLIQCLSGLFGGIIIGIFPLWWWFSADIMCFSVSLKSQVPKWMEEIAKHHPFLIYFYEDLYYKSYYRTLLRMITIVYILGFLIFSFLYPIIGASLTINILNKAGFDFGLLLMWLLPSYFVRRYLRQRKDSNKNEIKDNKASLKSKDEGTKKLAPFMMRLGFITSFIGCCLLGIWVTNMQNKEWLFTGLVFLIVGISLMILRRPRKII